MPSAHQATGSAPDYRKNPELVEQYGIDPGKYLSRSDVQTALGIIKGLDDPAELGAWRSVEVRDFGGRKRVLHAIEQRQEGLDDG